MSGEQGLLSSTILNGNDDFVFAVIFEVLNIETWNFAF